jgi:hypothetical protein
METVSTSTALDALIDEYFEKINALGSVTVIETGRLLAEFKEKTRAEEPQGSYGTLAHG